MKILCEVPLGVNQFDKSQFRWLRSEENYLFAFENERRLRIFSIKQDVGAAREVQSATVAESRQCSCLSWNKDESLLALVVDRRQIYFWDVKRNQFSHFKPRTVQTVHLGESGSGGGGGGSVGGTQAHRKSSKTLDIEFVAWSKVSDKLAICYASGQILLCRVKSNTDMGDDKSQGQQQQKQQQQQQARSFTTSFERFIDNSESLLKKVASIEVCEHAELFACSSIICEILVMSFDGQTKFYCQGDSSNLLRVKFSPLNQEYSRRTGKYLGQSLHLACQSGYDKGLYLKQIQLDIEQGLQDVPLKVYLPREETPQQWRDGNQSASQRVKLVDFYWLNPTHVLLCLESGSIQLIEIVHDSLKQEDSISILCTELFRINQYHSDVSFDSGLVSPASFVPRPPGQNNTRSRDSEDISIGSERSAVVGSRSSSTCSSVNNQPASDRTKSNEKNTFKMFELIRLPKRPDRKGQCFALAVATNFKLFYFELYETDAGNQRTENRFNFEHLDDIDLSDSLQRVHLKLERASWSSDCSMLSLQVTSGHLLVYKTRLQNFMVASHGQKTAYLSSSNEVTILNYGLSSYEYTADEQNGDGNSLSPSDAGSQADSQAAQNRRPTDNAIILSVQLKPSLLAIGPSHLAVALNNRVRFYPLEAGKSTRTHDSAAAIQSTSTTSPPVFREQEYITIVVGIGLSCRFVAIQFDDGRLKLHSIGQVQKEADNDDLMRDDERFFPDPSQPESIAAFALTEELLVYCTKERRIKVFSLASWRTAQVCEHANLFMGPVCRLKPNDRGNKFVCLVDHESSRSYGQDSAFLYDLYSNNVSALLPRKQNGLWPRVVREQIGSTLDILTFDRPLVRKIAQDYSLPQAPWSDCMKNIVDAIWDTDGRTLFLVGPKSFHVVAILCHTLEQEEPVAVYAASAKKPASYTILYISQGVVSYQTGSGRVINSILETHDDEVKLTRLETQIQAIKQKIAIPSQVASEERIGAPDRSEEQVEQANDDLVTEDQTYSTPRVGGMPFLEAHLKIAMLKLEYLCTILPSYSLPKCRDICKHLLDEESFNLNVHEFGNSRPNECRLINQLLPKVLAAWSLFTLNLNFASLVYKRNNILVYAALVHSLLDDIKSKKMDSRSYVNDRILAILGCCDKGA